ncbi:transcriptional regulator, PadR-family (plasmid) [Gemmatirosa kalamazoonensis]|uniref:Transcriptional regulator, PadR-family n=1 Tax=Gemmatirosa kalamazoonensis TaxID=861299 RepID=W0RRE2_9BACT|nr:PadR family transcriptional regulator [Gemmatirosa kalamazoonensis]AHG93246.1 transcriptional regulator, PadR-family [Gemmatirosa kalamazoonensis]
MADASELLHGTLDTLVLKTLSWGPRHGYGIARLIQTSTDDVLTIGEGALYPALYRMEKKGWVAHEWGLSENNREVKIYRLTPAGRARLRLELAQWNEFTTAVGKILHAN